MPPRDVVAMINTVVTYFVSDWVSVKSFFHCHWQSGCMCSEQEGYHWLAPADAVQSFGI